MSIDSQGAHCAHCQFNNPINASFCAQCGKSLTERPSPYAPPSTHNQPAIGAEFVYAGFWKRFIAYFIDMIILNFLVLGVFVWLIDFDALLESILGDSVGLVLYAGYYFCWWMYFAVQESSNAQATLGKRALGIKVTNRQGHPLSFANAAGRQAAGIISSFTFVIGYVMAAFTARKQALHDMIADAVVVNRNCGQNQVSVADQNPPRGMSTAGIVGVVLLVCIIPIAGILAAIAVPAYQDYQTRAKVAEAIVAVKPAQWAVENYAMDHGYWPENFAQTDVDSNQLTSDDYRISLGIEGQIILFFDSPPSVAGNSIYWLPELENTGNYAWRCVNEDMENKYLPKECRAN